MVSRGSRRHHRRRRHLRDRRTLARVLPRRIRAQRLCGQFYPNAAADGQSSTLRPRRRERHRCAAKPHFCRAAAATTTIATAVLAASAAACAAAGSRVRRRLDVAAAVAASVGAAGVTGATVSANVSCAGPATGSCTITLTLTSVETSKGQIARGQRGEEGQDDEADRDGRRSERDTRRRPEQNCSRDAQRGRAATAGQRAQAPVELVCVAGATRISTETLVLTAAPKQRKKH